MKKDNILAFDRSVRRYDVDGRLHVDVTNISKAMVCPYWGREIPGYDGLGLVANQIYQLLRDPEELAKAAPTFNNLPLLIRHIPVSAAEPAKESVVGSLGSDVEFAPPYLRCSLCVWDNPAIAGIETTEQAELSASYRYTPDMTPGVYEGVKYDGVMRNIIGNHVALVEVGRAGSDVVVADQNPFFQGKMMKLKTAQAQSVAGALRVYLTPKLAQDAAIGDLSALLGKVRAATYAKDRPALVAAITAAYKPKLATDASLADLDTVLASLAMDADSDEDDDTEDDPDNPGQRRKKAAAAADEPGNLPDGPQANQKQYAAMDAAIKRGIESGLAKAIPALKSELQVTLAADAQALSVAREEVKPLVGIVAMDSAEAVYRFALDHAKVDVEGVHPSAYRAIFRAHMQAQSQVRTASPFIAQDAAATKAANEEFGINRFGKM